MLEKYNARLIRWGKDNRMKTTKKRTGRIEPLVVPEVKFCPYCGSDNLKHVGAVPRCKSCRAVFSVGFFRYTRKSPWTVKLNGVSVRFTDERA